MEERLSELFKLQIFVENEHLARLISQTEQRTFNAFPFEELEDDELFLSAAGDLSSRAKEEE